VSGISHPKQNFIEGIGVSIPFIRSKHCSISISIDMDAVKRERDPPRAA
jgi:hypothetical protein